MLKSNQDFHFRFRFGRSAAVEMLVAFCLPLKARLSVLTTVKRRVICKYYLAKYFCLNYFQIKSTAIVNVRFRFGRVVWRCLHHSFPSKSSLKIPSDSLEESELLS